MISLLGTLIWIALPLTAWLVYRKRFPTEKGLFFSVVASLILGYVLYVGSVWMVGKQYEWELNRFDLDGDGSFSDDEYTPAAQAAMKRLTNDTGRLFAPIVAAPVTLIWVAINFTFLYLGTKIAAFCKKRSASRQR